MGGKPFTGQRVVSVSGRTLGLVDRAAGPCLRVRTDSGEGIWIGQAAIFTIDSFAVTLVCEREGLERYRVQTQSQGTV